MSDKMGTIESSLRRPLMWSVTALGIVILVSGCGGASGPERPSISGTVLLDGQPLQTGTISFLPAPGTKGPTAGGIIEDGEYSIAAGDGAAVGTARVEIRSPKKTGKQIEVGSPSPPGTMMDETVEAVPDKYNTNSTLTVEITSGENTHDFKLKTE